MMNTLTMSMKILAGSIALLAMVACGTVDTRPEGSGLVRQKLTNLQNSELASRAPVEIKDAEVAVRQAEQPEENLELAAHRVLLADRAVEIAIARAKSRLLVDQRKGLSDQRDMARLNARTLEADAARKDATYAENDAANARTEAARARVEATNARNDATQAQFDTSASKRREAELKDQIAELNAQATDRGLVVTLGDVLFSTNKSDLKVGATDNLDKLVAFMNKYGDRTLVIEGHTDNTGDADYNQSLSQKRAESVKNYLVSKGIASIRLSAYGKGESSPISGNDTPTGRQLNRRVEVIISNVIAQASRPDWRE